MIEKLKLEINGGNVFTILGKAASGKTQLLSILASELIQQGKKVLIIGDERPAVWKRMLVGRGVNDSQNVSFDISNGTNTIEEIVGERDFDCIILDVPHYFNSGISDSDIKYLRKSNTMLFMSEQKHHRFYGVNTKLNYATYVFSIEKIRELSLFDKLKYVWRPKPNTKLTMVKHRSAEKDINLDLIIDYK